MTKAKNYVALGFPGEFETTGDLARKLEELVVYNLPDDTFTNFVAAVSSVTAADLQRLAARYIQPDKMAVVVVGDRKSIEGPIRQLNLGPVNYHHHRRTVSLKATDAGCSTCSRGNASARRAPPGSTTAR